MARRRGYTLLTCAEFGYSHMRAWILRVERVEGSV